MNVYVYICMYIACMSVHVRDTKLNHLAPAGNAGNVSPQRTGSCAKQHFDSETHFEGGRLSVVRFIVYI